jgi:hypothetical protein
MTDETCKCGAPWPCFCGASKPYKQPSTPDTITITIKREDAEWWVYKAGGYGPILWAITEALETAEAEKGER